MRINLAFYAEPVYLEQLIGPRCCCTVFGEALMIPWSVRDNAAMSRSVSESCLLCQVEPNCAYPIKIN